MDEEIIGALEEQGLGKCDKVAMNMHAKGKVAYVCFNTVENATRCFDMYTRGDFVLDICTGLTLDWACNTPEVELDLVDAQDVPIKKAAKPSLRLLLTYPTREALTEIGGYVLSQYTIFIFLGFCLSGGDASLIIYLF